MSPLGKPTLIYLSLGFLPLFSNFLLAPFFTRYLSPREYGILALAAVFQNFLTIFIELGMKQAFSRFFFRYHKKPKILNSLFLSIVILLISIAAFYFVILAFFGDWLLAHAFKSNDFTFSVIGKYVLFLTLSSIINALFLTYFRNGEKIGYFSVFSISTFLIMTSGAAFGVIALRAGALGSIVGKMVGAAAVTGVFLLVFIFRQERTACIMPGFYKRLYAFGLPFIPFALLETVIVSMDKFFVERFLGLSALGQYNVAFTVSMVPVIFMTALQSAVNPPVMKKLESLNDGNEKEVFAYVNSIFKLQVLVMSILVMASVTAVAPAVYVMLGRDYHAIVVYVPLLLVAVLPYVNRSIYNTVLAYKYDSKILPKISMLTLPFSALFIAGFIKIAGVVGVPIALFCKDILQNSFYRFILRKRGYNNSALFRYGKISIINLAVYLCVGLGFFLTKTTSPEYAYGLCGLLFFITVLIILNRDIKTHVGNLASFWHDRYRTG